MLRKVISLIVFSAAGLWSVAGTGLELGDPAPDFALPGSDGKIHRLSDYRGQHVALAWFPKAFTGG